MKKKILSNMHTHPLVIQLRSLTRKIGLNKMIGSLIGNGYEDRFGPALLAEIRRGDMVWDIGANVGIYTAQFLDATGLEGYVVAFEPTLACFTTCCDRFVDTRVIVHNIALGDSDGMISMIVDSDPLGVTHHIVSDQNVKSSRNTQTVQIRTAESLVLENPHHFPSVVKIDVEGYEGRVLDGFEAMLPDRRLHCIGIEVHFGMLDSLGERDRPKTMQHKLIYHGFDVCWTDPSHLIATR